MKKYVLYDDLKKIETHIDFKGNLNRQQYAVVTEGDGPCLVLAGAGSGKTRTLIYRLAYLLERGVPAYNILLMTFTNKAAREMRERTEEILGYKPKGLWNGTFHHVGNRSLRMYAPEIGYGRDFGILDEHDSKELVKVCIKKVRIKPKDEKFPKPSVVRSIISLSTNTKKTIKKILDERYSYFIDFAFEIEKIKDIYEKRKKESNNMDYDDLLSKWQELLENVPEARRRFSEQFKYIMIDEYQDTNFMQADIINLLGEHHGNVLVVGDDAQSIYSFRGARVENILQFPDKFKGSKTFKLETNYRSTPEILELANDSLLNNDNQFEKELKAVNPSVSKPVIVEVRDLYSQARFISQRVKELQREGVGIKDIAVLFRAHYQSAELEMHLVKEGVSYVVRGGIRFFEQAHIKDVLSYLKVVVNPVDEVAWVRALTMCAGIGPGYAERIYDAFRRSGMDIKHFVKTDVSGIVPNKAQAGYSVFQRIISAITDKAANMSTGDMIKNVLEDGYQVYAQSTFENAKDRIDDIYELINFSHEYENASDFLSDITLREGFRGEVGSDAPEDEEQLVLSTIHQAKGLEWDAVFIIGLCEGQFPHSKSVYNSTEMEEERRLFYVAATRAKKYLYMIHPRMLYDYKKGLVYAGRSEFLEELIPEDYEIWEVGSSSYDRSEKRVIEI